MKYPVCCHTDNGVDYSITAPDVSGCFGAGESTDAALAAIEEALHAHFELLAEDKEPIPQAGHINEYKDNPDCKDGHWDFVDFLINPLYG